MLMDLPPPSPPPPHVCVCHQVLKRKTSLLTNFQEMDKENGQTVTKEQWAKVKKRKREEEEEEEEEGEANTTT